MVCLIGLIVLTMVQCTFTILKKWALHPVVKLGFKPKKNKNLASYSQAEIRTYLMPIKMSGNLQIDNNNNAIIQQITFPLPASSCPFILKTHRTIFSE